MTIYGSSGRATGESPDRPPSQPPRRRNRWPWLLSVPLVLPLLTPLYNRIDPRLWGMPFFYWYQLALVVVDVVVITVVYQTTKTGR
jgi:hypothetical protein